ncbi:hypothetical protein CWM52_16370 [Raoultella sp. T31]|nr:hypothetical protein CWM52_16370 [Raoultella sp. T31]
MIFAWSVITIETTDQANICQRSVKKIAHFVSARSPTQRSVTPQDRAVEGNRDGGETERYAATHAQITEG